MTSQRPVITETAMDAARAGLFASVQYLNKRITEEPRPMVPAASQGAGAS